MLAEEQAAHANEFSTYIEFAKKVSALKERELEYLGNAKKAGKTIYGFGAPVKGNTLLNYFGIGPELIACLTERNPHRRGLVAPGSHIPVKLEDELTAPPDVYYVLAWNFKAEILARHQADRARGVEFYFPVNPREV